LLTVGGVNGHEFEKAQFTQTDPAPLGAGSTFERSYVYAYDNPLKSVDPNVKRGVAKGEPEATISAGPEIERACTHGQVNFRSTCLFAQLVGSTRPGSLDDLTLGSTGSIGSLLETYGFESFGEAISLRGSWQPRDPPEHAYSVRVHSHGPMAGRRHKAGPLRWAGAADCPVSTEDVQRNDVHSQPALASADVVSSTEAA
jgi:hypothetical protein